MNNKTHSALKQVLFIDDSAKFTTKLRTKMPAWSRDKWELSFATDPSKAFVVLDTQHIDLVVIDLRMSGMDSLQFLKLVHQKHPHVRKAILSSFLEQDVRKECLQSGADMYLTKPKRSNGFEAIFHSLNQLFTFSQEGFRGLLRTVSLTDLIQLECLNTRSSVLEISAGKQFGRVFIKHGVIIHAQAGSKTGVDAFVRLMHMSGGDFNLKPFVDPGIQTIEMSCDRLLIEASHAVDKGREQNNHDNTAHDSNTSWFRNEIKRSNPSQSNEIPSSIFSNHVSAAFQTTESASPLTNNPSVIAVGSPSFNINLDGLDTVMKLTDDLIANRSQLDMKIMDMALLKEELNSCKSRLIEATNKFQNELVITQSALRGDHDIAAFSLMNSGGNSNISELTSKMECQTTDKLSILIRSLDEINNDTSMIVSQLDGFFANFTEESSNFNETSIKLQNEIARLQEVSAFQNAD